MLMRELLSEEELNQATITSHTPGSKITLKSKEGNTFDIPYTGKMLNFATTQDNKVALNPVDPTVAVTDANKARELADQQKAQLTPGKQINIAGSTSSAGSAPKLTVETDSEYDELNDSDLIDIANHQGLGNRIKVDDSNQLLNRDEIIELLKTDQPINGTNDPNNSDRTDQLINQVRDPSYGQLAEIKRLSGI